VDVAVQTDFAEPDKPEKGVRSARTKKKSVFFNTVPWINGDLMGL
jgi:hypothetical protein